MRRILFFFVDGVGLGPKQDSNPLSTIEAPALQHLAHGQQWIQPLSPHTGKRHLVRSLDATLGIEGLPQSGTGQASLLTGVNCAEIVGRHFGPFPHSKTHPTLQEQNLFRQIRQQSGETASVSFANAFPPQYFEATRRRSTVTTYCCEASEVPLRDVRSLRTGDALAADLTGRTWRDHLHLDVPERTLPDAADVLVSTMRQHALTLFEYFLTDKVGHRRIDTPPESLLQTLDQFLGAVLQRLDPTRETLLITSDHGNLEDTSHTQHTRNPVPLLVYGWAAPYFTEATTLTDVTPGIVTALRSRSREHTPPSS